MKKRRSQATPRATLRQARRLRLLHWDVIKELQILRSQQFARPQSEGFESCIISLEAEKFKLAMSRRFKTHECVNYIGT
jgi:hypothetical protein